MHISCNIYIMIAIDFLKVYRMDNNNIDLVIYILVTLYVGYRLFNTLGQVSDDAPTNFSRPIANDGFVDVDFEDVKTQKRLTVAKYPELTEILRKYPDFNVQKFLEGSEAFLTMLLNSVSNQDLTEIKHYISAEIFTKLQSDLENCKKLGKYTHITLVECKKINILNSSIHHSIAEIELEFVTEQIIVTKDASGKITKGNPGLVQNITATHRFKRNMNHSNPSWILVN